ncbi:wall-associated receptor kinase-like 8 [Rosa rugosa]|uniref:wall-associated receptor kinase-like 8 n=1 Tax=Rosa rugosa TaxID=74645 RepID=UPI002B4020CF|nr:wall-associated receptor kinase-like 8 [Rosa rugosa]XP_062009101.1 wall-associated receptor kinase-like 8 [Rosa rugosa]XP_062009102.1 wall-associated receptor kinase-like 8 [Rosa rugosa]
MMEILVHQMIFILLLSICHASTASPQMAKRDCPEKCGNVIIRYPFGIGPNESCYYDEWFQIDCNEGKPFLRRTKLEVLNISTEFERNQTLQVYSPVTFFCEGNNRSQATDLTDSPFVYSRRYSIFTAASCNSFATFSSADFVVGGCRSLCNQENEYMGCDIGINCCQSSIPPHYTVNNLTLENTTDCNRFSFLVDKDWFQYTFNSTPTISQMQRMRKVPVTLFWSINNHTGPFDFDTSIVFVNGSTDLNGFNRHREYRDVDANPNCYAWASGAFNWSTLFCYCPLGYEGNPYLGPYSCHDIDECQGSHPPCRNSKCVNEYGSFRCEDDGRKAKLILATGLSSSLGLLLLLIGVWFGYKLLKKKNEIKRKKMFFKRNGGLLLEQQLSSGEVNVEKIKLFKSQELEKSTDNFNVDRILGQGGQGTVYKGMLEDGRIVAVKKSKIVDENQLSEFINEVVILSQINHRNVVQLLGCCLETEVPLLVYEFIPNGTLSKYITEQVEDFPLTWKMRLRIATEIAGALSYLHYAASFPIYHRDIKSTNILLDDKYRAKIADFGTSRSIAIDQTHLTTSLVHGTFGYLDPEYFQSSQFTEKSDVYSFGVVLVELLTGQKPISFLRSEDEGRSLATYFIISMHKDRLFEIVDAQVLKEGSKEDIIIVANLARRCLNLNGRKRPTMREVTAELEVIQMTEKTSSGEQNYEEVEFVKTESVEPWDIASSSTGTGSALDVGRVSSFHEIPLLSFKSR